MSKTLMNRHKAALTLVHSRNVPPQDLCGLLLSALHEVEAESGDPKQDPAVRLIASKFADFGNVTLENRLSLIEDCERRLNDLLKKPYLLQIVARPVTESADRKAAFHQEVTNQLRSLAVFLSLRSGTFEVRSDKAEPASSETVILHAERIYVHVSMSIMAGQEILYRRCEGRTDHTGGTNHFAPITDLVNPATLADTIRRTLSLD